MISVTLEEKNAIRERFPKVHIARTMKGDSKRHHYYVEEAPGVMKLVRQMRGYDITPNRKKKRGHSSRKN